MFQNTRCTIPSCEFYISCNKYTIPMKKTPSKSTKTANTPIKTPSTPNINLCCFVALKVLSQIYTLFWRTIYWCKVYPTKTFSNEAYLALFPLPSFCKIC